MTNDLENFSKDQISAYDAVTETLKFAGVDLTQELLSPKATKNSFVLGVIGRAGTGKTLLISKLFYSLCLIRFSMNYFFFISLEEMIYFWL